MLERFHRKEEIGMIKYCADVLHKMNVGECPTKFQLTAIFSREFKQNNSDGTFTPIKKSIYQYVKDLVRNEYPDMHEDYLPFAVKDLLKEAYENLEEVTNGVWTYIIPDADCLPFSYYFPSEIAPYVLSIEFWDMIKNNADDDSLLKEIRRSILNQFMCNHFEVLYQNDESNLPETLYEYIDTVAKNTLDKLKCTQ